MKSLFRSLNLLMLFAVLMSFASGLVAQQHRIAIIPKPVELKSKPGSFALSGQSTIVISTEADRPAAEFLRNYLETYYRINPRISYSPGNSNIILRTVRGVRPPAQPEAYRIKGSAETYIVEGNTEAGTFRGMQTIIQLLPTKPAERLELPIVDVRDEPRFAYRGLHFDVVRHFSPISYVKKYIDYLALHKMNYFHWHLTDDQGWRIEIKKYPNLTKVGAHRKGTIIGRYPGKGNTGKPHGGYYTQDEIREIVRYAAERHITVVPEIEMPGHALAALASYPQLGCTGGPYEVQQTWGIFPDVFCAGNDEVFRFLEGVLDEVVELFPSEYIHIGGDECPKKRWQVCPKCQQRIKDNKLKDEQELQSYFIRRIEKYLNGKGRRIIGWDEILEGGLAPNATVMSWRGEKGGIAAAKMNHDVIMTPSTHIYLDHTQTKSEDSVVIGGYSPLEKVYRYDPVSAVLTAEQGKHILGAQGNLWTEYITNPSKVEYMLFPRASALSEVVWSPASARDWEDFLHRLEIQVERYKLWGTNYFKNYRSP